MATRSFSYSDATGKDGDYEHSIEVSYHRNRILVGRRGSLSSESPGSSSSKGSTEYSSSGNSSSLDIGSFPRYVKNDPKRKASISADKKYFHQAKHRPSNFRDVYRLKNDLTEDRYSDSQGSGDDRSRSSTSLLLSPNDVPSKKGKKSSKGRYRFSVLDDVGKVSNSSTPWIDFHYGRVGYFPTWNGEDYGYSGNPEPVGKKYYRLWIQYASAKANPVVLKINERIQVGRIATKPTNSEEEPEWVCEEGPFLLNDRSQLPTGKGFEGLENDVAVVAFAPVPGHTFPKLRSFYFEPLSIPHYQLSANSFGSGCATFSFDIGMVPTLLESKDVSCASLSLAGKSLALASGRSNHSITLDTKHIGRPCENYEKGLTKIEAGDRILCLTVGLTSVKEGARHLPAIKDMVLVNSMGVRKEIGNTSEISWLENVKQWRYNREELGLNLWITSVYSGSNQIKGEQPPIFRYGFTLSSERGDESLEFNAEKFDEFWEWLAMMRSLRLLREQEDPTTDGESPGKKTIETVDSETGEEDLTSDDDEGEDESDEDDDRDDEDEDSGEDDEDDDEDDSESDYDSDESETTTEDEHEDSLPDELHLAKTTSKSIPSTYSDDPMKNLYEFLLANFSNQELRNAVGYGVLYGTSTQTNLCYGRFSACVTKVPDGDSWGVRHTLFVDGVQRDTERTSFRTLEMNETSFLSHAIGRALRDHNLLINMGLLRSDRDFSKSKKNVDSVLPNNREAAELERTMLFTGAFEGTKQAAQTLRFLALAGTRQATCEEVFTSRITGWDMYCVAAGAESVRETSTAMLFAIIQLFAPVLLAVPAIFDEKERIDGLVYTMRILFALFAWAYESKLQDDTRESGLLKYWLAKVPEFDTNMLLLGVFVNNVSRVTVAGAAMVLIMFSYSAMDVAVNALVLYFIFELDRHAIPNGAIEKLKTRQEALLKELEINEANKYLYDRDFPDTLQFPRMPPQEEIVRVAKWTARLILIVGTLLILILPFTT